jgi:hypothetical protein
LTIDVAIKHAHSYSRSGLESLLESKIYGEIAFIYISSHGVPLGTGADVRTGIVVEDTVYKKDKKTIDEKTCFTASDLMTAVNKIKTKVKVLILDICHSGGVTTFQKDLRGSDKPTPPPFIIKMILPPATKGTIIIVSSLAPLIISTHTCHLQLFCFIYAPHIII